jgi:hypothetical protein
MCNISDDLKCRLIERLDQGHLYPQGEHPNNDYASAVDRTQVACVKDGHKELSRQHLC